MSAGRPPGSHDRHGKAIRVVPLAEARRWMRGRMDHLRDLRESLDVSASEVAAAIGVTVWTVLGYETGKRLPPIERLYQIATALGVQLRDTLPEEAA